MVPSVFVSSTIEDLHHLRDSLRDVIHELAYVPVMSDYGDIGYMGNASAEQSCYQTIKQCQIAILIVAKRYGSKGAGGIGITHSEFRAARDIGVPVISLVDQELLHYKKVYDANPSNTLNLPGMDSPADSFAFIEEIKASPVNNGILSFQTVAEARSHVKKQLALFMGELLRDRGDAIAPQLQDILAELKTLRHELTRQTKKADPKFLSLMRFMLDRKNRAFRDFVEYLFKDIESAAKPLFGSSTIEEFVAAVDWKLEVDDNAEKAISERNYLYYATFSIEAQAAGDPARHGSYIALPDKRFVVNKNAYEFLAERYAQIFKELPR